MLLHEENYRQGANKRFLSRHYYDILCLLVVGVADEAALDQDLFNRVLQHRKFFFNHNCMDYSKIAPGTIRLFPLPEDIAEWESDYSDMEREMFYGSAPQFDEILEAIKAFQDRFNGITTN